MSHHRIPSAGLSARRSLLCAAVGALALSLAPVAVSAQAQPPAIENLVCEDQTDRTDFRTLIGHIQSKNATMLKQVIGESPDIVIECHGPDGYNALHHAAYYGDIEGAKILLDAGADRRKESSVVATHSPCPETPYGVALALNRLSIGTLRPPALLDVLDYDPRNVSWVAGDDGGSVTGDSDDEPEGTAEAEDAGATSDNCNARNDEIRRWVAGRAH
ncbi:MAG: hypothetical protein ISN28_04575 [Ectothiorhodospiraceae bacterium AqS1]|nr:hypothetical protein [Ectothiorhodospiraceae bacterium AqS1]